MIPSSTHSFLDFSFNLSTVIQTSVPIFLQAIRLKEIRNTQLGSFDSLSYIKNRNCEDNTYAFGF